MQNLLKQIKIRVNENIYVKDPETSDLGKRIIMEAIHMIDQIGLEHFTFKKLAEKLNTTESSIYRYFENKHNLLIYLTAWFWGWLEYKLVFYTVNIEDPIAEWESAIKALTEPVMDDEYFPHINTEKLNNIVISESSKTYLTKDVGIENELGFFNGYDSICNRLSTIVNKINPDFKFSRTLCSTILEGIQRQKFFIGHLPALTDLSREGEELTRFFYDLSLNAITSKK